MIDVGRKNPLSERGNKEESESRPCELGRHFLIVGHMLWAPMEKRVSFAYGRTLVTSRVVILVILLAALAVLLAFSRSVDPLLAGALGGVLAAYLVVFILSPLFTDHWVTRSRIVLRQGWYFRAVVAFSEILDIGVGEEMGRARVPLGIVRPFGQPALFVTAGRTNLVTLRLRKPRRFWQSFGLRASEVVFDVVDRAGFLAAVEERQSLFAPVQADRANAELRD